MFVYTCENCHFTFLRSAQQEQCPDCGKFRLRIATEDEKKAFEKNVEMYTSTTHRENC